MKERIQPRTICCGVPLVWTMCAYWDDGVWEGQCIWCKREFAYLDPCRDPVD